MGQVCQKHNQFYETECRWCETPAVPGMNAVPLLLASNEATYYALAKPITQANGLTLPVSPYRPDPTTRADVAAAWDAVMAPPNDGHGSLE